MDLHRQVVAAEQRIRSFVRETPVEHSLPLSAETGCEVMLKLENFQVTGSFKARGALNKLLGLGPGQRGTGVVAASSGNHGAGVAYGLRALEIPGVIYVPHGASAAKVSAIASYGAEVRFAGDDCVLAEAAARAYAQESGAVYVSPYNDLQIVAGQGTTAVELKRQVPDLDAVFVALGGGGLIGGIAAYLKRVAPKVRIIACSPANSCVMHESAKVGRILDLPSLPTLSDGTAGGLEVDTVTLPLVTELVDDFVLVDEDAIADAMRLCIGQHHMLVEGAAGVAVGGFRARAAEYTGKKVAVVLCGGNISLDVLASIL